MYGKFTSELRDFARSEADKMRREQAERRLEERESRTASGGQTSGGIASCRRHSMVLYQSSVVVASHATVDDPV